MIYIKMPRCPKGSRKNKKTGNCDSVTSNSSPASIKTRASPASATRKVRRGGGASMSRLGAAEAKIYLTAGAIDIIIDSNMDIIEEKGVSIPKMKEVLSKVYYKPKFESEFYDGRALKRKLKKRKISADDIVDRLLVEQAYALIREWGKSYITLADFTSSESFYSHSSE